MRIADWIIPHKRNKFHPHALRPLGLFMVIIIVIAIQPLYNITSAQRGEVLGYATAISSGELNALTNQERINNGLTPYSLNSQLTNAAYAKAQDMFSKNYWAHVAPDGTTPWYFISSAGYNYVAAGENLAKDFSTSSGVVAGWMGSPAHRANILSGAYQDVGYAVVNGNLQGSETTLVVAMYGQPQATPPAPAPQPTAPATTAPTNPPPTPTPTPTPAQATDTPTPDPTPTPGPISKPSQAPTTNEKPTSQVTSPAPVTSASQTTNPPPLPSKPINVYTSLNWGQKASLLILSTVALLFVLKHTLVWREQKRGLRNIWLRSHPLGQASILAVSCLAIVINSVGVIL